ncbi:hypothetical protein V5799_011353 [Amblyomma americanum]|uniref:Uncharacterized protein n=1 Tax=Amblyomma americanum TaxID=6943 RepID=A0AAQ4EH59_AMBAM
MPLPCNYSSSDCFSEVEPMEDTVRRSSDGKPDEKKRRQCKSSSRLSKYKSAKDTTNSPSHPKDSDEVSELRSQSDSDSDRGSSSHSSTEPDLDSDTRPGLRSQAGSKPQASGPYSRSSAASSVQSSKFTATATYGRLGRRRLPAAGSGRWYPTGRGSGRRWFRIPSSYDEDFTVQGIEVFIKTVGDAPSFLQLEVKRVTTDLIEVVKEPIPSQRVTYNGNLIVTVGSAEAAARLLRTRQIAGYKVSVKVKSDKHSNIGKITNVPLGFTDEELQGCFVSQGVIHARRQVVYTRQADMRVERVPTFNVILTFRPDKVMPTTVVPKGEATKALGDRPFVVRPHYEPPIQCMCCQRYGHMARFCLRSPRCKVCSGPHNYKECAKKDRPLCANCKGPHAATFTRCPLRRLAAIERIWSLEGTEDD